MSLGIFYIDFAAMEVSAIEAGISDAIIIGVTTFTTGVGITVGHPVEGAAFGLALGLTADVFIASNLNPIGVSENAISGVSTVMTLLTDKDTKLDFENNNINIGKDTIVATRNFVFGTLPESNWDTAISLSQVVYDEKRLFEGKPGGSFEIIRQGAINWEGIYAAELQFYTKDWIP